MKRQILFILLLITTLGFAQQKGTLTGTITDKDMNNETLPFASVSIKGTGIGENTDENGKYSLEVPAGSHVLVIAFMGYETVEVPFTIAAGETKTINRSLTSGSVTMEEVVIQATVNREKESALLMEQKNATEIKTNIGAQELTRKGVSDAAAAVTKVSGISKQEGNSGIFVRGLGDRYNGTFLNGLPLPSNEPENKNIALDLFQPILYKA
ncbi:TonB-dependent receptor [Flavobacterium sp. J372]|uniref:carboxypeptidase-like regulatory domain-containing protein n=1 Tax=Flavobacterium sp. J372 TaxID=2898436 RepID=UPI002150ECEF|nr:TonB-dependent receptor [Flavobacterium sp. J372]MCR5860906.1 TonB-dependent receptor [Flavobacterium sp. J372]